MRTILFICLLALGATPTLAGTIYKSVDESGNVTYSDRPPPGAQPAEPPELPPVNSVPEQKPSNTRRSSPQEQQEQAPAIDYRLSLLSPAPETSVPPGQRDLPISVQTSPALAPDHTFVYYLDGEVLAESRDNQFVVKEIFRGAHQVRVAIIDQHGAVLTETDTVTIYVHRPSKLN